MGREMYNKTLQAYKLIIAEYTVMKIVAILGIEQFLLDSIVSKILSFPESPK